MRSFFIGQSYVDVTMITDVMPTGDDKDVAKDFAVSFGGNAVTAAFACAKITAPHQAPDLLCSMADDWLGRMFRDMAARYGIPIHGRKVERSSLSFILPKDSQRAILRARDDRYLHPFPMLNLGECKALHLDGHQPDAALFYAKLCREKGILTSLDGGGLRPTTEELLGHIDVAIVAERLCEQMNLSEDEMLAYLKKRGVRIGGVTQGERGMLWYDESGKVQRLPALSVPAEKVIDTSGAGDVFHGTYLASYLERPDQPWVSHFKWARAGSAFKVQHLGNEAGLPSRHDIEETILTYA